MIRVLVSVRSLSRVPPNKRQDVPPGGVWAGCQISSTGAFAPGCMAAGAVPYVTISKASAALEAFNSRVIMDQFALANVAARSMRKIRSAGTSAEASPMAITAIRMASSPG